MAQGIAVNESQQIAKMIEDLWDNRVEFAKYICGMTPSDQQGDLLAALDKHDYVTAKSGHGIGKTTSMSTVVLHYASTRYPFKVPCTAPSKHQIYDVLWAEISLWHQKMHPSFRDMLIWTKEYLRHKDNPENCFAAARTATKDKPESLQGFHSDFVLRVVDEASAVPEDVFDVLEGATGIYETKEIMCGNPTRLSGHFYDSFHKDKHFYKHLTFSCIDSQITPKRYIERMRNKWGEESNMWRIRVLGEFPEREGDSFIPYNLAYDASIREIMPQDKMPKVFGCDIARYGDDQTVIAIRQGDEIRPLHVLPQQSTMHTANYIAKLAAKEKPKCIFVDVIGLGAGVYDRLEELGYPVVAVNVAESPAYHPTQYKRLRDELWGLCRDWLEERRGRFYDNEEEDIIGELTTPKYTIASGGKIVIESKDSMKKRGFPSPNKADAINMTFAMPTSEYTYTQEEDEFWDEFYGQKTGPEIIDKEAGY